MLQSAGSKMVWASVAALLASLGTDRARRSVTLYGIVDAGLQYASKAASADGQSAGHTFALTDGANGPSLIGIKGTEYLAGGFKASFDLHTCIALSTPD